ncbi:DUF4397 domain-containing protein [Neobacillus niacini]|uniref:DUF4397 domain-containing protein n=1 Tax=Neobacillus niacini TaxID=86668 RepID=UPI00203F7312|nr:DUF4397 domain-containing protein [Neobacillus niacini]MCM3692715.1 DUF4397 domain-containing protein [Neobacillus niacini]
MSGNRNHSDYLQRAAMYDLMAHNYKYSNPNLHMHYYLKHLKYMNKAMLERTIQQSQTEGRVRFLHTSPDAPEVDIYINGQMKVKRLPFRVASNYLPLKPGKYHIDIYPTGNSVDSILNKKITVEPDKSYTLAIIDPVKKLRLLPYLNQPEVPMNESKIRFLHLSPDTGALDIAVKNRDVVFPNISYKQTTDYLGIMPMTVDLEVREAGTKNIILPMPKAQFRPNETYTIVLIGLSTEEPALQAMILKD